jgi:hypothetical protein
VFEQDVSHYHKWMPRIEDSTGLLANAVELVWEQIKALRPPCLTGDGHPAICFTSNPIVNPRPDHDPLETDRSAIVEYNRSIHNPQLPDVIALDSSELKNRCREYFTPLIFAWLDFRMPETPKPADIHGSMRLEG